MMSKHPQNKFSVATLFLCGFLSVISPAYSQDAKGDIGGLLPQESNANRTVEKAPPTYFQMNYANLFRLGLAWGMYKADDKDALDNYLKISECTLYNKFYRNEFEWEKIRKAARVYLDTYNKDVPMYYEYVQPLKLGRYDVALQGFPLEKAKDYMTLKTLQIANFKSGDTPCGLYGVDSSKYPSAGILNIISPLSLTFVRVPKELAERYIAWRAEQGLTNGNDRQAYIRYRVRIDTLDGKEKISGGYTYIFSGRLMQIDVFADKDLLMPLYNQLF